MVVQWRVEVGVNNDIGHVLNLGEIVEVTHETPGFRWSPTLKSWIPAESLVKTDRVDAYFSDRIETEPSAAAYHDRGVARLVLANHGGAIADFSEAIRLQQNFGAALTNRGRAYLSTAEFESAVKDFDRAIQIDGRDHVAFTFRGVASAGLGQFDASTRDLSQAIAIDSTYVPAWNNRGVVYRVQHQWQAAESDFTEVIRLDSTNETAFSNRAFVRSQLGRYAQALEDYESAMLRTATPSETRCDLAWLLATCPDDEVRDGQRALRILVRIEKEADAEVDVLDAWAATLAELGRFDEAVEKIDKALAVADDESRFELEQRKRLYLRKVPYRAHPLASSGPNG